MERLQHVGVTALRWIPLLEFISPVGRALGSAMSSTLGSAISTGPKGRVARGAEKVRGEEAARA